MLKSELRVGALILAGMFLLAACDNLNVFQQPDDKAISSGVQAKLFQDPVLKTRDIRVDSQKGVVTLTGTVGTELEKAAVEHLAGQVGGVKHVMNQLTVSATPSTPSASQQPPAEQAAATAPPVMEPASGPTPPTRPRRRVSAEPARRSVENAPAPAASAAPAETSAAPQAPAAATPPPATPAPPEPQHVTIPAGTVITIRMIDSIDSARNRPGEEFAATVDSPVVVGERVVIPRSSDARVRLVEARSAGRMTGSSELELELVEVSIAGNPYAVQSGYYQQRGASRGTRTAETVGGGAALGALIGAIAGKGKGAAIGAAVGAGAGTAVQAGTRGQQVKVPSETKLDFTLKAPVTVTR